jgi:hypothetical protein
MSRSLLSPGIFDPEDLALISDVYREVCKSVDEGGEMQLTPQVRESIAISIFEMALRGEREAARLRSRAMREAEAYNGVKRVPSKIGSQLSIKDILAPRLFGEGPRNGGRRGDSQH